MKKSIIIIFIALTSIANAQSFEGTLSYTMDFEIVSQKMLDMGLTKEIMKSKMKAEGTWADTIKTTYKNGFYKQLNLTEDKSWIIYRPDSNKLYTLQEGEASDICIVNDPSIDLEQKNTGKLPKVSLLDTIVEYQKYRLQMVEVKWKAGTYYYLFDKKFFKANPDNFKGHIYDGFYEFLKISKSFPIIIIKEAGKVMRITVSLIDSSEHQVSNAIFNIPELVEDEELISIDLGAGKMMRVKE